MEIAKRWAWRLAIVLLVLTYFSMLLYIGTCVRWYMRWGEGLWGQIYRFVAEGAELLSFLAPIVWYPLAYRLRKRRGLCLLLVALPVILLLPMALELGWTPGWWS